ncbi:dTDP-4-amino-4,6-dideoxygalactose transaminase [Acetoanaerobium noterae]|uniref:dTDP-4-amino-4,6-dideoxygalactose transaminase n=1 Tax=Acetoanaerobium noterae TaxID=745369 RepID=A0A1T5D6D6_9FIRM|nr:DegT/DnrJ/EryC1/StrS family aminotransferase [Acetoanaerobium noterae]SKB67167.1 dTDP-4-amino-4,6-dideoxygalactose transaminase [Acetoanaerobium noterae]
MIKLAQPHFDNNEYNAVKKVLDSGNLVQGKFVNEFEKKLSEYIGINHTIVVSNGTAALHLALLALDIKPEEEIIVPAYTFPATANVVELIGAKPVFVDVDLNSLCIDTNLIESKITKKTRGIIPVHEFGHPADMDKLKKICDKFNIHLIEDAACALGSKYKNKKIGLFGDLSCFSFHPRKSITTGEGGAICTNNSFYADKLRIMRNHGISYIDNRIEFVAPGFNYRMTDIQGALGVEQLCKIDKLNNTRINLAKYYNKLLKGLKQVTFPQENCDLYNTYQTYHILINEEYNRDDLIIFLKKSGIECNYGAYDLISQPFYKNKYNNSSNNYKNSNYAFKQGLALPLHSNLNYRDIDYIVGQLKQYFTK